MSEDPRCCGSGTCIIDAEGRCWCGQRWDGQKMSHVPSTNPGDLAGNGPRRASAPPLDATDLGQADEVTAR